MTPTPDVQVARDSITFVTLDDFRIGARTMRDRPGMAALHGSMTVEECGLLGVAPLADQTVSKRPSCGCWSRTSRPYAVRSPRPRQCR